MEKRIKKKQKGFTVLEALIAISIIILIGFVVASFILDVFSLNDISGRRLIAQEEARRVLKIMSSEIRTMSASDMGAYAIAQAGTSTISFFSNVDDDSLVEQVRYFLDGASLKKGVTKPSGSPLTYDQSDEKVRILVENITNTADSPIFNYYDTDYDGTSSPLPQPVDVSAIRLVKVQVSIGSSEKESQTPLLMTTQISIRNLKDNL